MKTVRRFSHASVTPAWSGQLLFSCVLWAVSALAVAPGEVQAQWLPYRTAATLSPVILTSLPSARESAPGSALRGGSSWAASVAAGLIGQEPTVAPAAQEEDAESAPLLTYGSETTFVSSYVWRGFVESEKRSLQPGGWLAVGPVSLESWFSFEMADGETHMAEYDLNLLYTKEFRHASVTTGVVNYFFDHEDGSSGYERHTEASVVVAGTTTLQPTVEVYYSLSHEKGMYASAGLSRPFRIAPRAFVTAEAAVGYNHRMWIDKSGFTDLRSTLKLSLEHPSQRVRLDVGVDYNHALMPSVFSNRWVGVVGLVVE